VERGVSSCPHRHSGRLRFCRRLPLVSRHALVFSMHAPVE